LIVVTVKASRQSLNIIPDPILFFKQMLLNALPVNAKSSGTEW